MNKKINDYIIMKNKENDKLLNHNKEYNLDFIKKNNKTLATLSIDNKKLLVGEYNFYGIFQHKTNLWIWASSIPGIDKSQIRNINKIKKFSYLFESDNNEKINFYYQLLTQDVLLIDNEKFLDWIKDLIMYLSNDVLILTPSNSENNIQFITIKNIIEKYN
jgi:hypothetical protein